MVQGACSPEQASTPRSWRAEEVPAPVQTEARSPQLCLQVVAGCPVAGWELAPARKVAFLPGGVSIGSGGHVPQRGQALAPGRPGSQGSQSSPDEIPGICSALGSPLAGCFRKASPDHLTLQRGCPRGYPLRWLNLLGSLPPAGAHPSCGHSAGPGGGPRLLRELPEGREVLPRSSELPVPGGVRAGGLGGGGDLRVPSGPQGLRSRDGFWTFPRSGPLPRTLGHLFLP